ncbi:FAD-binding protein [Streptomyces sp. FXJ1.4098]|nr:FAD-binding protein [Streptomyces sp. FXJ1.4098]
MIEQHLAAAARTGVHVRFDAPVTRLATASDGTVNGVVLAGGEALESRAVVLAAGGFEADPQMRAAHLGPGWDLALVRGTPPTTPATASVWLSTPAPRRTATGAAATPSPGTRGHRPPATVS